MPPVGLGGNMNRRINERDELPRSCKNAADGNPKAHVSMTGRRTVAEKEEGKAPLDTKTLYGPLVEKGGF